MRCAIRCSSRCADRQTAGLLAALIVGDQNAIERGDWDVFRATGVAHLMSISGLHITMFAWLAALLVGALWRRSERLCLAWPAQHAALVGGVLLAAGYALFSGWGVPAQRTIWMLATVGLLRLSGRRWPWPSVWLLACAVVVAIDPWALLQAGFWLSFVAVGVLFAADPGPAGRTGPTPQPTHASRVRQLTDLLDRGLREQWVDHAGAHAADVAAVRAGLGGRPAGQCPGHSLGHAGHHAAGLDRRRAAGPVDGRRVAPCNCCRLICNGWRRCRSRRSRCRPRRCGPAPPASGRRVAGAAAALVPARARGAAVAAGVAVAGGASGARAVRIAGCGRGAGQRRDRAHRRATPWSTTAARATAPRATPAIGCWCRCCGRWTSGSTSWC